MWWLILASAASASPEAEEVVELVAASHQVQQSFVDLDADGFAAHLERVRTLGARWEGVMDPGSAAAWHKAEALWTYAEGADARLPRHVVAAKRLDPYWSSPLVVEVEGADATVSARSAAVVWGDGERLGGGPLRPQVQLPRDRAVVLQIGPRPEGALYTPDAGALVGADGALELPQVESAARRQKVGRIVATSLGAGMVVTGGVLWGVASQRAAAFHGGEVDAARAQQFARETNALSGSGVGVGVAGLLVVGAGWSIPW